MQNGAFLSVIPPKYLHSTDIHLGSLQILYITGLIEQASSVNALISFFIVNNPD
jgi:hypothetical protein